MKNANHLRYKKNSIPIWTKRIIISWAACLSVGGIIGSGITATAFHSASINKETASEPNEAYNSKAIVRDLSIVWNNSDFVPIDCALPKELQEYTYYMSNDYVDYSFVLGLMYCESGFQTDCISETEDCGLMQINKLNCDWLSEQLQISDITDPYQNIRAGLYILRQLFEKYDDPAKVAMAYNMGEYGASVLWEQGIYETSYSEKVLAMAEEYREQLENNIKK